MTEQPERLEKQLGFFSIYAIATGTTLSAGIFLLPGIAALQAGPALVLSYLLAVVPLIPATCSILELSTALPRAGGVYYFLDRSLGPAVGSVGGWGTWLALLLKVAFALVGMGAYIALFQPDLPIRPLAIAIALALGGLNLFGARKSGQVQLLLVVGLLVVLTGFIAMGLVRMEPTHFNDFTAAGLDGIVATAGLVFISYVGVTKVASLSEEVADPERTLPVAVFLALATAVLIYGLATLVLVGVLPLPEFQGDLTPMASAADRILGRWGLVLVSAAALAAFTSVANAGTLSSSRYPLAMSRDHLMPPLFRRLNSAKVPYASVALSTLVLVVILTFLDVAKIAKLASSFQLLMFALVCLAVIVLRESRLEAYDPGFRSPLYPWMQLFGIAASVVMIWSMGPLTKYFSLGFVAAGLLWYRFYAHGKVSRSGAIYHLLARIANRRLDLGLESELRQLLREKGLRDDDPFESTVTAARFVDLDDEEPVFDDITMAVADSLELDVPASRDELNSGFLEGNRLGTTLVADGAAMPHLRLFGIERPELVIVRARRGVQVDVTDVHGEHSHTEPAYALFYLVSPEENPQQHFRILAELAERVASAGFVEAWRRADDEQSVKEILLRDEHFLSVRIRSGAPSGEFIGRTIREISLGDDVLIALIHRQGEITVPRGQVVLQEHDRLTLLGEPTRILSLRERFSP